MVAARLRAAILEKMPSRKRLWLVLETSSGSTPVRIVRTPRSDDGTIALATYNKDKNDIEIGIAEESLQKKHLFHETIHKWAHLVGTELMEKIFGTTDATELDEREELLANLMELSFYDILTRNGWLKIPDPPKLGGWSSVGGKKRGTCKDPRAGLQTKTTRSSKRSPKGRARKKQASS